jgi:hypothetical protein
MHLRILGIVVAAGVLCGAQARAEVRVSMANGRVSVSASNATPRQILIEWARVGQTQIVNAERLTGPPISIELADVSEAQALDTLLRTAGGGYLAAPRATDLANASQFDRIFIVVASSPVRPAAAAAPPRPTAPMTPAAFQAPSFPQPADQPQDDQPAQQTAAPPPPSPVPAGPAAFSTFPQPQAAPPRTTPAQAAPNQAPNGEVVPPPNSAAPVLGVARPGMPSAPVPATQQPGLAPR